MITDTALQVASDLAHRDALTESERDALGVALDTLDDDTTAYDRPCVGCAHLVTADSAGCRIPTICLPATAPCPAGNPACISTGARDGAPGTSVRRRRLDAGRIPPIGGYGPPLGCQDSNEGRGAEE